MSIGLRVASSENTAFFTSSILFSFVGIGLAVGGGDQLLQMAVLDEGAEDIVLEAADPVGSGRLDPVEDALVEQPGWSFQHLFVQEGEGFFWSALGHYGVNVTGLIGCFSVSVNAADIGEGMTEITASRYSQISSYTSLRVV